MSKYDNIFEPITIKHMTVNNRIVMCPMGTNFGEQNGEMSFLHIDYYEQRAKGGTGLIIVENACVDYPSGSNGTTQLRIDSDNYIPRLYKFAETIHKYGTKIAIQLNHAGASALSSRIGMQPVSASNIPNKAGGETPRALTKEEIYEIADKYAAAAKRAQIIGFDAVEIHGGHSYLISQFLSPTTNNRSDEFGGSYENRARFAKLVIEKVREAVGPHFPIFMRISADEFVENGNSMDDTLKLLEYFEKEIDMFDVSCGLSDSIYYQIDMNYLKDGWRSFMAKAVKDKFHKPVMTMGNIRNPDIAEMILERGDADFIGLGRQMIADPAWVNKVKHNQIKDIRKCISCNIGCSGHRIGLNRPVRCSINPDVFYDNNYKEQKIKKPCNVVVIGGGTAGLEAACSAAEVGCTTFIIEKNDYLGGLSRRISRIPEKKRINDFPEYLVERTKKLRNLIIFTSMEAKTSFIEMLKPDIIVNATGSTPLLPPIKGLKDNLNDDNASVYDIEYMMAHIDDYQEDYKDKKICVIGGGAVGLDVVEFFSNRNADVTIVEMQSQVGKDLDFVTKVGTYAMLKRNHVNVMCNTKLLEVKPHSYIVENQDHTQELSFDLGFVCLGMRAYTPILDDIRECFKDKDVEILNIGDSLRARRIIDGVAEGRNILYTLKSRNYL